MSANRVKETTSTTGSGPFTTTGEFGGFRTFYDAYGTFRRFTYWAINNADEEWEEAVGYLSTSTNLVRETIEGSSNSNAVVTFTTAPTLFSDTSENNVAPTLGVLPSNTLLCSAHFLSNTTSFALNADRVYYVPFLWLGTQAFDAIGIKINSFVSLTFRLGLYENNKGDVGNLIVQTGTLNDSAGTFVSGSVTSQKLPVGWYFAAVVSDGAINTKTVPTDNFTLSILGAKEFGSTGPNWAFYKDTGSAGTVVLPSTANSKSLISDTNLPKISLVLA
jgi:hypothetical protein